MLKHQGIQKKWVWFYVINYQEYYKNKSLIDIKHLKKKLYQKKK